MLIPEAKMYRNYLVSHEDNLINHKINVETVLEWQELYQNLLRLQEERKELATKTKKEDLKELQAYLEEQDNYLNNLVTYMQQEMAIYENKGYEITDKIVKNSFQDIITLCAYNSVLNKLTYLENLALKDPVNDYKSKFVNNFGQTVLIPETIANTYENLLLKQMELVDGYNTIIYSLKSGNETLREDRSKPIKFDLLFYLAHDLVSKKLYLEIIINKILNAERKNITKVKCYGKTYEIPRKYKALFLDLQLKLRIVNEHIEKSDLAFVQDHSQVREKPLGYEIRNLENQDFPEIDFKDLSDTKATSLLVDVLGAIQAISKKGKESPRKDTIVYKDKYALYYVNKSNDAKFKDLYGKRLSLEKKIYHLETGFNSILTEIRNRLVFLKNCLISTSLDDEINLLTAVFCEEYQQKLREKEEMMDKQIVCKETDRPFYKSILLNMNDFLHSKKLAIKEKRAYLNQLDRLTNYTNPDIHEGLEFLDLSNEPVAKIESIKPSKNIDKLLGSLNKIFPFVQASLLTEQVKEESALNKDLDGIVDLTEEIALKKQDLLNFLDSEGIKR